MIFHNYLTNSKNDKIGFIEHHTLVLQVAGILLLETSTHSISLKKGEMLLIRKNQLGNLTKQPLPDENYETVVIQLHEDMLRQIALQEQIQIKQKYVGLPNIKMQSNDLMRGFFQSIKPYVRNPEDTISDEINFLKVKEAVTLLMHTMPVLRDVLFDFSESHKIDLEKFMLSNYHYNISIDKFARLTGRSLASFKRDFQKIFNSSPRQWLQEKRLTEALHLIEKKHLKPSDIYIDLGFETLSHFSHSFKKRYGKSPSFI